MGLAILTGLCAAGESFLFYVLVRFFQEDRRETAASRRPPSWVRVPDKEARPVPRPKVIQFNAPTGQAERPWPATHASEGGRRA